MPLFLTPAVRRALLLAVILAAVAALTAPAVRGSTVPSPASRVPNASLTRHSELGTGNLMLAEEWSWHEFVKFWQRHLGTITGVVGTVTLIAAIAAMIILSKRI